MEPNPGTEATGADNECTDVPRAERLVFMKHAGYKNGVKCIYDNDTFTELLMEEFDSFVLNPWSWILDAEIVTVRILIIAIAIATLTMNVLVMVTFIREKMMSALNIIMIGISISDTLTVCIPALTLMVMLLDERMPDYIPYEYCNVYAYFTKYLPTITHNASVWLTVVLAYDRYIAVEKPLLVKQLCLPRRSVSVIIGVYVFATAAHLVRFLDTDYAPVKIVSSQNVARNFAMINKSLNSIPETDSLADAQAYVVKHALKEICQMSVGIETCRAVYKPAFRNFKYYEFCYYWFMILFVKFIPCTTLIILDTLMLRSLRRAERLRQEMTALRISENASSRQRRKKYEESRRMTLLLVLAIVISVIVELPIAIILIFWTLATIHGQVFITEMALNDLSRTANTIVYISYPIMFLIYCCLSAKFRASFCRICCRQTRTRV